MTLQELQTDITTYIKTNGTRAITGAILQTRLLNMISNLRAIGEEVTVSSAATAPAFKSNGVTVCTNPTTVNLSNLETTSDSSKVDHAIVIVKTPLSKTVSWTYGTNTFIDADALANIMPGSTIKFQISRYGATGETFVTFEVMDMSESYKQSAIAAFWQGLGISSYQPASQATVGQIIVTVAGELYAINASDFTPNVASLTAVGVCAIGKGDTDDGFARMISLVYMRTDTPDSGGQSMGIYWNGYGTQLPLTEYSESEAAKGDYNGASNTAVILSYATDQPNWKTDTELINFDSSDTNRYFPAACSCWRFHTPGTKQGDWYLPALGELWTTWENITQINNSLAVIPGAVGLDVDWAFWSSTCAENSYCWYIWFDEDGPDTDKRDSDYRVRSMSLLK